MKISELVKNLQEILEKYGDLDLITAIDDEGNGFNEIYFEPSIGYYEDHEFDQDVSEINACCVN